MTDPLDQLVGLLDLEQIEVNLFRGFSPNEKMIRVFGGQVLGQALVAASRTVEDREAHSLHGYFLRPGDPEIPIIYDVDRIRDGKSFTTRRVVGIQHGRAIFNMSVSFQIAEAGIDHQSTMPDVPMPEDLMTEQELRASILDKVPEKFRAWYSRDRPIEIRPVNPYDPTNPPVRDPAKVVWFRARHDLPEDPSIHKCVLAYASDMSLLETCLGPHGLGFLSPNIQMASLDHCMWFHRPFKADEWMLYVQDSPSASGARGFNRGEIYSRDGVLIASVTQEGLARLHEEKEKQK
jgi:acyl-CoA thioesterase II